MSPTDVSSCLFMFKEAEAICDPPGAASTKVLAIAELIETILIQVPPLELLLLQRVSKTWRAAIKESKPLQRKLFFEVDPTRAGNDVSDFEWNPFLMKYGTLGIDTGSVKCLGGFCMDFETKDINRFDHRGVSWRKTLVAHPVDTEVIIGSLLGRKGFNLGKHDIVRMSDVVDYKWDARRPPLVMYDDLKWFLYYRNLIILKACLFSVESFHIRVRCQEFLYPDLRQNSSPGWGNCGRCEYGRR